MRISATHLTVALALLVCQSFAQVAGRPLTRAQAAERASALSQLGRKIFFDPSLSGSGRLSCASCHDPLQAYGPPNGSSVQVGGRHLLQQGIRAVPSLRYLQKIPEFSEHYFDLDEELGIDNGPSGGLTWDGRVDRGRDQARIPLLSPLEMANDSPEDVVTKAKRSGYAAEIDRLAASGSHDPFSTLLEALETWEQEYREFYPYSSKYDSWLAGRAQLTELERQGLRLFSDPAKGNCARCHIATRGVNGTPPQFTDYGYAALGVPRNPQIRANADPSWFDLGLCGPEREDLQSRSQYCGQFRTPTLRNSALRKVFFHNGVVHTLREAVAFYAQRDTRPGNWYPRKPDGTIDEFDDLPPQYRGNIERDAPFGTVPDNNPVLDDAEIDAIVAFLQTLSDGFAPTR